jgi:transcriptional regulator with XRE-family HTH domain
MRVEHNFGDPVSLPEPEVLAGQELKRLRRERGWSQEEVARRMTAYGFDWHQTTVGRTETAARPLRVNEAVALAALFEVPVTQLLVPVSVQVADLDEAIAATEEGLTKFRRLLAENVKPGVDRLQAAYDEASEKYYKFSSDIERLQMHLNVMRQMRDLLRLGHDLPPSAFTSIASMHEFARSPAMAALLQATTEPNGSADEHAPEADG